MWVSADISSLELLELLELLGLYWSGLEKVSTRLITLDDAIGVVNVCKDEGDKDELDEELDDEIDEVDSEVVAGSNTGSRVSPAPGERLTLGVALAERVGNRLSILGGIRLTAEGDKGSTAGTVELETRVTLGRADKEEERAVLAAEARVTLVDRLFDDDIL